MLADILSTYTYVTDENPLNDVEYSYISFENDNMSSKGDQLFEIFMTDVRGKYLAEARQKVKLENLMPLFTTNGEKIYTKGSTLYLKMQYLL